VISLASTVRVVPAAIAPDDVAAGGRAEVDGRKKTHSVPTPETSWNFVEGEVTVTPAIENKLDA